MMETGASDGTGARRVCLFLCAAMFTPVSYTHLLVVFAECLFIIGKESSFHLALVKEIIPFIDDGFKTSASDGFRLLRHDGIEVLFPLVLWSGIDVDAQRCV